MRVARGRSFGRARAARARDARAPAGRRRRLDRCGRMKSHAPMFSGSSCTQTISSASGRRRASRAARASAPDRAARAADRDVARAPRGCSLADEIDVDLAACRRATRRTSPARAARLLVVEDHAEAALRRARAASTPRADGAAGSSASARRAAADRSSSSAAWRRSRWKYCAAVVQLAIAHVDVGGELQEPLGPRAGVIGPLPFVRVRQQQHERRPLPPLAARRHDELVDHRPARR